MAIDAANVLVVRCIADGVCSRGRTRLCNCTRSVVSRGVAVRRLRGKSALISGRSISFTVFSTRSHVICPRTASLCADKVDTRSFRELSRNSQVSLARQSHNFLGRGGHFLAICLPLFGTAAGRFANFVTINSPMGNVRSRVGRVRRGLLITILASKNVTVMLDLNVTGCLAEHVGHVHETARRVTSNGFSVSLRGRRGSRFSRLSRSFGRVTESLGTSGRRIRHRRGLQHRFVVSITRRVHAPLAAVGNVLRKVRRRVVPRNDQSQDVRLVRGRAGQLVHLIGRGLSCRGVHSGRVVLIGRRFSTGRTLRGITRRVQAGTRTGSSLVVIRISTTSQVCTSCSHFVRVVIGLARGTVRFAGGKAVALSSFPSNSRRVVRIGSANVNVRGGSVADV